MEEKKKKILEFFNDENYVPMKMKEIAYVLGLDKEKFSPYKMYQYLINTADSVVIDHLKKMTLLSKEEIEELERKLIEKPEARDAAKALAFEVVKDIHGEDEALKAQKTSEEVFTKGYSEEGMPQVEITLEENMNILDLLVKVEIAPSKSEARRLIVTI